MNHHWQLSVNYKGRNRQKHSIKQTGNPKERAMGPRRKEYCPLAGGVSKTKQSCLWFIICPAYLCCRKPCARRTPHPTSVLCAHVGVGPLTYH